MSIFRKSEKFSRETFNYKLSYLFRRFYCQCVTVVKTQRSLRVYFFLVISRFIFGVSVIKGRLMDYSIVNLVFSCSSLLFQWFWDCGLTIIKDTPSFVFLHKYRLPGLLSFYGLIGSTRGLLSYLVKLL